VKIFIICSKAFYGKIPPIKAKLESAGHQVILPNSYDNPDTEKEAWALVDEQHQVFKKQMFRKSKKVASSVDAVLVLNFEKNGVNNYIGGATFLELYEAFMSDKKIFLWNNIPEGILFDEIHGFAPTTINGDIKLVR
jgi:hypothetical protein